PRRRRASRRQPPALPRTPLGSWRRNPGPLRVGLAWALVASSCDRPDVALVLLRDGPLGDAPLHAFHCPGIDGELRPGGRLIDPLLQHGRHPEVDRGARLGLGFGLVARLPLDLPLRCRCGRVRGVASDVSSSSGFRFVCYCEDCQAFARFLERPDVLDPAGGTDIFQSFPFASQDRFHGKHYTAETSIFPALRFAISSATSSFFESLPTGVLGRLVRISISVGISYFASLSARNALSSSMPN